MMMFALLIGLLLGISARIAIVHLTVPQPQAIFVLGGDFHRLKQAAELAKQNSQLEIWVSDFPRLYQFNFNTLQQLGVSSSRIHFDFCATDTVTNFTCTLPLLRKQSIFHVYLVTSDYHLPRAKTIAFFVFGSQGIVITPIPSDSQGAKPEPMVKIVRDSVRCLLWLLTGKTGACLNPNLN